MRSRFLLALSLSTFACSAHPTAPTVPDDTTKFVGKWNYQSGSAIVADCSNTPRQTIDLSRVPPDNQPAYFVFTATAADRLHEVDARGCQYDWAVAGNVATASGQSCLTFPDGRGGNRIVRITSGTKTMTDSASISVDVHFTSDDGCTIHVLGQTTKS